MAIALTIGLIAWIERAGDYGSATSRCSSCSSSASASSSASCSARATRVFARLPTAVGAFAPVASLAAAALAFGAADVIGGSGFLAVYLVGLAVGSTPSRYRRQLVAFHEGIAFLAQVTLFIVLGLLVFPSELPAVALLGTRARGRCSCSSCGPPRSGPRRRSALHTSRAAAARLGGPARGGADRARDVRALVGRPARRRRSSTPSSSSSSSRRSSRGDARVARRAGSTCSPPRRARTAAARGRRPRRARAGRVRRRGRARDRGLGRARARPAAHRDRRRRRARPRLDPAARQHRDPARRPPLRPRAARDAPRRRGRLLALAAAGLTQSGPGCGFTTPGGRSYRTRTRGLRLAWRCARSPSAASSRQPRWRR